MDNDLFSFSNSVSGTDPNNRRPSSAWRGRSRRLPCRNNSSLPFVTTNVSFGQQVETRKEKSTHEKYSAEGDGDSPDTTISTSANASDEKIVIRSLSMQDLIPSNKPSRQPLSPPPTSIPWYGNTIISRFLSAAMPGVEKIFSEAVTREATLKLDLFNRTKLEDEEKNRTNAADGSLLPETSSETASSNIISSPHLQTKDVSSGRLLNELH